MDANKVSFNLVAAVTINGLRMTKHFPQKGPDITGPFCVIVTNKTRTIGRIFDLSPHTRSIVVECEHGKTHEWRSVADIRKDWNDNHR